MQLGHYKLTITKNYEEVINKRIGYNYMNFELSQIKHFFFFQPTMNIYDIAIQQTVFKS